MEQQVSPQPQMSGARDTATSASEGRLKVDAAGMSKKKILKHVLKKVVDKVKSVKMKMK